MSMTLSQALNWPSALSVTWPQNEEWRFWTYKAFAMILPVSILATITVTNIIQNIVPLFPVLFRMVRMKKRNLICYDILLTSSKEVENITRCMYCVLRIVACVVWAFLWEILILEGIAVVMPIPEINLRYCKNGWDCFKVKPLLIHLAAPWGIQDSAVDVCASNFSLKDHDLNDPIIALCHRFPSLSFTLVIGALGAAFAISALILIFYECLVWLMLHDRSELQILTKLYYFSIILSAIFWLLLILNKTLQSATTWIGEASFLSIPIIIHSSIRTVSSLQRQRKIIFNSKPSPKNTLLFKDDGISHLPHNLPESISKELDQVCDKLKDRVQHLQVTLSPSTTADAASPTTTMWASPSSIGYRTFTNKIQKRFRRLIRIHNNTARVSGTCSRTLRPSSSAPLPPTFSRNSLGSPTLFLREASSPFTLLGNTSLLLEAEMQCDTPKQPCTSIN